MERMNQIEVDKTIVGVKLIVVLTNETDSMFLSFLSV